VERPFLSGLRCDGFKLNPAKPPLEQEVIFPLHTNNHYVSDFMPAFFFYNTRAARDRFNRVVVQVLVADGNDMCGLLKSYK